MSTILWDMVVSAYGDPLKLQVFPLAADATILFNALIAGLVEVRFFIGFEDVTHRHVVLLCISTVEAFEKPSSASSLAGNLFINSIWFTRDRSESFHDAKPCDI